MYLVKIWYAAFVCSFSSHQLALFAIVSIGSHWQKSLESLLKVSWKTNITTEPILELCASIVSTFQSSQVTPLDLVVLFYSWFTMSSKNWINAFFLTKFSNKVYNLVLKDLCKLLVDKPLNARVTAVQSLENLHTFILLQPWWWAKECPQVHFPI